MAGVAANWGVQIRPISTPDGLLTGDLVRAALRPASPHVPRAGAVAVENTHNAAGGRVLPPEGLAGIVRVAGDAGLRVHLDGARLWNAAVALGLPVSALTRGVGTVMVSFSKGLGCPVGACLALGSGDRGSRSVQPRSGPSTTTSRESGKTTNMPSCSPSAWRRFRPYASFLRRPTSS